MSKKRGNLENGPDELSDELLRNLEMVLQQRGVTNSEHQREPENALGKIQELGKNYSLGSLEVTKIFPDKLRVEVDGEEFLFASVSKRFEGDETQKPYLVRRGVVNVDGGSLCCMESDYTGERGANHCYKCVRTKEYVGEYETGEIEVSSSHVPHENIPENDLALFDAMTEFFALIQNGSKKPARKKIFTILIPPREQ